CVAAGRGSPPARPDGALSPETDIARLIWLGILLSAIGLALLIYDRLVIQDIDFGAGLAAARMQWMEQGRSRTSPSSMFSVLGYLFGSVYFASLTTALSRPGILSRRQTAL